MLKISFSWDDGAVEDFKIAELSAKYRIPGMFFIPEKNPERAVISAKQIVELRQSGFEIGAHTQSHVYLTKIAPDLVHQELSNGKTYLETVLSEEIKHFCLPGGFYNKAILSQAQRMFASVRTADTGNIKYSGKNPALIKPTFHFYDRGVKSLLFNSLKHSPLLFQFVLKHRNKNYFEILKSFIDYLATQNADYQIMIWGHSWEIEQFGLWPKLEAFISFLHQTYPENLVTYDEFVRKT
jgi:peptidoglycan/xylan/chitin deacetylase (PgdA/CDA1 family)